MKIAAQMDDISSINIKIRDYINLIKENEI